MQLNMPNWSPVSGKSQWVTLIDSMKTWIASLLCSDGRFGEGDPQVMVVTHVIIVEVYQGLYRFLNSRHLQQRHFVILEKFEGFHSATGVGEQ